MWNSASGCTEPQPFVFSPEQVQAVLTVVICSVVVVATALCACLFVRRRVMKRELADARKANDAEGSEGMDPFDVQTFARSTSSDMAVLVIRNSASPFLDSSNVLSRFPSNCNIDIVQILRCMGVRV